MNPFRGAVVSAISFPKPLLPVDAGLISVGHRKDASYRIPDFCLMDDMGEDVQLEPGARWSSWYIVIGEWACQSSVLHAALPSRGSFDVNR